MTDQHRYECLSCHGHPMVKTPNIDRLAENGVDFQRCYAQSAICMPSRLSMYTGQYLHTHGVQENSKVVDISRFITLPNILKEQGYQTAAVGKTHAGPSDVLGFDYYRICAGMAEGEENDYKNYLREKGLVSTKEPDQSFKAYDSYVSDLIYADTNEAWTGDECLRFLENRDNEKPFFLWATFQRPHAPTSVPVDNPFPYNPKDIELPSYSERWYTKPDTRRPGCENTWNVFNTGEARLREAMANYFSMISMVDDQVGRILNSLEDKDELEDTIVIFTADHGDFCGEYGQFGKNISTFDVLYRIPSIWYWKGKTGREQIHEMTEMIDTMPTILDLLNLDKPKTVQGDSLADVIHGSRERCGRPWDGKEAVFFETPFIKTVRTKTHKLSICNKEKRTWGQLYDLVNDPLELNNLYQNPAYSHIQQELTLRLVHWFIKTDQPQIHSAGFSETAPPWRWYQPDS
ncbi:MAG: sulfatase-like hydrolase/transferase [Phycisphaerae bacterium]|nr:sulfatase-like hydrolase/transferase [Phycisphaerae bacterium]